MGKPVSWLPLLRYQVAARYHEENKSQLARDCSTKS